MADPRATAEIPSTPDVRRTAWVVLVTSFVVFCALSALLLAGIYVFLFQSNVPMMVLLNVSRGTVGIIEIGLPEQVVRRYRELSFGTVVQTDPLSQASLSFADPQQNRLPIVTLTLRGGATTVKVLDALRPRFDWNTGKYLITLADVSGDIDVYVSDYLGRDIWLAITTRDGTLIYLTGSGLYRLDVGDTQVRVFNRTGKATLISADLQQSRDIPVGQDAVLPLVGGQITLSPPYVNLLREFSPDQLSATAPTPGADVPAQWQCVSDADTPPPGDYRLVTFDGRDTLHLARRSDVRSHGETRCSLFFAPASTGVDVSGYSSLVLRSTFYVNYQSLSVCGILGSECPLMLRMDYIDVNGVARTWFHGFYGFVDDTLDWPLRCDSCTLDHELINLQSWYTYDSGNLFSQFPPEQRPRAILNVRFYASGHQYDVYVSDIALLAGAVNGTPGDAGS